MGGMLSASVPVAPVSVTNAIARSPLALANLIGDPDEVTAKILYEHELLGFQRFLMQMTVGTLPHDKVLRSIELFGTVVAPVVRAEIARRQATREPCGGPDPTLLIARAKGVGFGR